MKSLLSLKIEKRVLNFISLPFLRSLSHKSKGVSTLDTECALNAHSIRIDRVRTRNIKVPNRIQCALSQSTFVCGLNPVRSGLECNVDWRSLRHMNGSVYVYSRARSVSGNAGDCCPVGLRRPSKINSTG